MSDIPINDPQITSIDGIYTMATSDQVASPPYYTAVVREEFIAPHFYAILSPPSLGIFVALQLLPKISIKERFPFGY